MGKIKNDTIHPANRSIPLYTQEVICNASRNQNMHTHIYDKLTLM